MPRLLILANLELAFEIPDGADISADAFVRLKERRLLRVLETLAGEHPKITGSLEQLEYESFSYASEHRGEPSGYYYNKHSPADTP